MTIALLTDGIFPYILGGMQKHAYYLAKYFAKSKISVDIYHPKIHSSIELNKVFSAEELNYIKITEISFPKFRYFPGHYILENYIYSGNIYKAIKHKNYDFIYAKGLTAWYILNHKKSLHTPVGIQLHGLEMFQDKKNLNVSNILLRWAAFQNIVKSDCIFSYGGKILQLYGEMKIPQDKIIIQHGGVEPDWIIEPKDVKSNAERTFIFIGRFERRKGLIELNEAINQIINDYNFRFYFLGNIPFKYQIKSLKCIYLGTTNSIDAYRKFIDMADIIVVPSLSEGLPTVILECMARGLAPVATDVGAVSEIVNNNSGWLINPKDINALKNSLIEAITLPEKEFTEKKIESIKAIKSKFLWPILISDLNKAIQKII